MKLHSKALLCIILRFYMDSNTNVVCGSDMNVVPDFDDIRASSAFVDTRGLIPALFESAAPRQFQLITTPHKFGKTANLKMLKRFLEVQYEKKTGYRIFRLDYRTNHLFVGVDSDRRCSAHFNKYSALIYVSFKINVGSTYEGVIKELGENIRKAFTYYEWVYDKLYIKYSKNDRESRMRGKLKFMKQILKGQVDEEDIVVSLVELSKILMDFFIDEDVFLLIDDYDSPVITAIEHNLDTGRVMNLVNRIFNLLFNVDHDCIRHAVIMGTLDVLDKAKFAFIKRYYFPDNDRLCRYFGFIETETETLLERLITNETERRAVMQYYNGYTGYRAYNVRENIYNTFSMVSYLSSRNDGHGKLGNYWAESNRIPNFLRNFHQAKPFRDMLLQVLEMKNVTFSLIRHWSTTNLERIKNDTHRSSIISFEKVKGKDVTQPTDLFLNNRQVSRILSYLYHHGYLTRIEESETYRIPNKEVETYFRELCEKSEE